MAIARADGETVGFTHGGHLDDFDGNVQVSHQPFDNRDLLRIFLPEIGAFRMRDLKQLQHDCRNALKMTRPKLSAEVVCEPADMDGALWRLRIDFARRGGE